MQGVRGKSLFTLFYALLILIISTCPILVSYALDTPESNDQNLVPCNFIDNNLKQPSAEQTKQYIRHGTSETEWEQWFSFGEEPESYALYRENGELILLLAEGASADDAVEALTSIDVDIIDRIEASDGEVLLLAFDPSLDKSNSYENYLSRLPEYYGLGCIRAVHVNSLPYDSNDCPVAFKASGKRFENLWDNYKSWASLKPDIDYTPDELFLSGTDTQQTVELYEEAADGFGEIQCYYASKAGLSSALLVISSDETLFSVLMSDISGLEATPNFIASLDKESVEEIARRYFRRGTNESDYQLNFTWDMAPPSASSYWVKGEVILLLSEGTAFEEAVEALSAIDVNVIDQIEAADGEALVLINDPALGGYNAYIMRLPDYYGTGCVRAVHTNTLPAPIGNLVEKKSPDEYYENLWENYKAWAALEPGKDYVAGELCLSGNAEWQTREKFEKAAFGFGKIEGYYASTSGLKVARLVINPEETMFSTLMSDLGLSATPNFIATWDGDLSAQSTSINDPLQDYQWYLTRIESFDAWDYSKVNGSVRVAVLDSGVDPQQPDLVNNLAMEYAWNSYAQNNNVDDLAEKPHGTLASGVIAAESNNGLLVSGVSYNADIVPVKISNADEQSTVCGIFSGLLYVYDIASAANIRVVNISSSFSDGAYSSQLEAAVDQVVSQEIAVVCSAGNDATSNTRYPSDFASTISVTAIDGNDLLWENSSYGSGKNISAPGTGIVSTARTTDPSLYASADGTSYSSPIVAGVCALLFAYNPDLTADQVKSILYTTADDLGASGWDQYFGWGVVDAEAAMQMAVSQYPSATWRRIDGDNRYETARKLIETGWTRNSCSTVIVATGDSYPDALAGASLAGVYDCPIVLTSGESLSEDASIAIRRLGADHVIVLGGPSAVSATAYTSIEAIVGANNVERVYGSTRYETNYMMYQKGFGSWSSTAIIATGTNFPDCLAVSSYAYAAKAPVFYTDEYGALSQQAQAALSSGGFSNVVIIGGTAVVSSTTEQQASSTVGGSSHVIRLSGSTRYATSSSVSSWATGHSLAYSVQPSTTLSYDCCCIATGANFPDGLAAGPLCGENESALLLVDPQETYGGVCLTTNIHSAQASITRGYIAGGTAAVPASIQTYLNAL